MVILNLTRETIPARNAHAAAGFGERLSGLIGKRFSPELDGMVFDRCNAIHTFFMRYPIDVIFADSQYKVLKAVTAFPPWRPCLACRGAFYVIELPAGTLATTGTEVGDQLDLTGALSPETIKHWLGRKLPQVRQQETCSVKTER